MNVGMNTALAGLRESLEHFERMAKRVTASVDSGRLATDIVEMNASVNDVKLQAAVVKTHDEIAETLLDMFA